MRQFLSRFFADLSECKTFIFLTQSIGKPGK